jgi:MFS family permease
LNRKSTSPEHSTAGRPRIDVVFATALATYLSHTLIRYSVPLYLEALGYPKDSYETFAFYWLAAFIAACTFSGLLASRFDERLVWTSSLVGFGGLGVALILIPGHWAVPFCGVFYGLAAGGQWVGAMAMVQTVSPSLRGRANSLLMIAIGVGSFVGAPVSRAILGQAAEAEPGPQDFIWLFCFHVMLSLTGAFLVWFWSRHPGQVQHQLTRGSWKTNLALLRMPRYLGMVIPLSIMGGPVFQTVNIYLPYRASDPEIDLIAGSADQGWSALLSAGYGMQLLGGIAILLLAGKKASARMASLVLASYAACSLGIGFSPNAYSLFLFASVFELFRQMMRWSQTGYISEHMPLDLRAPAIGFSTTLSGLSSTLFAFIIRQIQSPNSLDFSSSFPFFVGGTIGLTGALLLLIGHATILKSSAEQASPLARPIHK